MKGILLGYEVGTGEPVRIPVAHTVVTGITQKSGKTTTLEAIAKRSGLKSIVFRTKVGEASLNEGQIVPPYFQERSDWEYVRALLEAAMKQKLRAVETACLIRASKGATGLIEIKNRINNALAEEKKLKAFDRDMFTLLQAYFNKVLPQLQTYTLSNVLSLNDRVNIMDLECFSGVEVQSLIIASVAETILKQERGTLLVVPEAWEHLPEGRNTPCKLTVEALVRKGAAKGNFVLIDSQDITGIEKAILKQASVWILGLQLEVNEVKRTLEQVPLPPKEKPKVSEIMRLPLGHFFVCTPEWSKKVYVCPAWLDEKVARAVAVGEKDVADIKKPSRLAPYSIQGPQMAGRPDNFEAQKLSARIQGDIAQLREDFFGKIQQVAETVRALQQEVFKLQGDKPDINHIASLVLQKMPLQAQASQISEEAIISKVLERVPRIAGTVTYEVAPLEKIRKDF